MAGLDLVSDEVLQEQLRVSRSTLWRLRQQGMPSRRVGRSVRYPLKEVQIWLETRGISIKDGKLRDASMPTQARLDLDEIGDELLPFHWSESVALDPKHRPQVLDAPSSTVRRDWRKFPQEAHLLDVEGHRYRRLTTDEIAVLQGFPRDWAKNVGLTPRERIAGLGNAVPPPLGAAIFTAMADILGHQPRTSVEICAGFGGLALGAHQAFDIETLALVEVWEAAVRVLRTSGYWEPGAVHLTDIRDFEWGALAGSIEILSGGPPCQPWSQSGLSKGAEDERDLLGEMPTLVGRLHPGAFIFENVPGLMSAKHRPYLSWLVDQLRNCAGPRSYGVAAGIVQAADYGVPQKRKRVVIAGIKGQSDGAAHDFFDRLYDLRKHANPAKALMRNLNPWVTIRAALPEWDKSSGWRRWLSSGGNGLDGNTGTATGHADVADAIAQLQPMKSPAMGLVWPSRDHAIRWNGNHWQVLDDPDATCAEVTPLIRSNEQGNPLSDPWYVVGDQVKALESLRAAVGRTAKLVYFDTPRLETDLVSFASEDRRSRLNTWLTLLQASMLRAISLVRDEGVVAIITGHSEQPYLQVMLDEMFGPENRIGTVVWQKGYSVQGQKKDKPKKEIYPTHDYVLVYSRRREECLPGAALKGPPKNFSNPDGDPRGPWKAEQKGANYRRESSDFSVILPPYRWELIGGNPPPWIWRISPKTGVIWAPAEAITETGEWTICVRVADMAGATVEKEFTIRVESHGDGPIPASPGWLIARDADGKPNHEGDPANAPKSGSRMRIVSEDLPVGVQGKPYFACIEASGGTPWTGTTRPGKSSESGKSRYWDVSFSTLERAVAEDAVDFKSNDDSIPAIKVYLDGADFTYINQISTWRGNGDGKDRNGRKDPMRVGWGQDAKIELEELLRAGLVEKVVNIGKPAGLMARITALFTEEGDLVVDVGSPAAEMAALACQLGRRVAYLESPGSEADRTTIRIPRLCAAARGVHPVPDGVLFTEGEVCATDVGYYVGRRPRAVQEGAGVCKFRLGEPFMASNPPVIDYARYPAGGADFLQALASLEGLAWMPGPNGEFARSYDGTVIALHFDGNSILDARTMYEITEIYSTHLGTPGNRLRVYYHRGLVDLAPSDLDRMELRHIPFDLALAVGGWV